MRADGPNLRQYLIALAVIACGLVAGVVVFVPNAPEVLRVFVIGVGALLVIYVLGSTMSARPLRKPCPTCGADALEKLRPGTGSELGVRCTRCGFEDPSGEPDYLGEIRRSG